jgi:hypothetical protein
VIGHLLAVADVKGRLQVVLLVQTDVNRLAIGNAHRIGWLEGVIGQVTSEVEFIAAADEVRELWFEYKVRNR